MWQPPIYGSQVNPRAKIYKRFTPTENFKTDDTVMIFQKNYYRARGSIAWTEADDMQGGTEQPVGGLLVDNSSMTIKFYGSWKHVKDDPNEPDAGDILMIDDEAWIVEESGAQRVCKKSMKNLATVYLPIRKLL